MKKLLLTTAALMGSAGLLYAMAADPGQTADEVNAAKRDRVANAATSVVPAYEPRHFLRRQAIAKLMERQDTPDKIWYVYIHAEGTGSILGYYTSSTPVVPYCTAMTPTQKLIEMHPNDTDEHVVDAPNLDGVYGGGDCNTQYFFDAATDALVMTQMPVTILDQPLAGVEVPQLVVQQQKEGDQ